VKRWSLPEGHLASLQRLMKVISHLCMYDTGKQGAPNQQQARRKCRWRDQGGR